MPREKSFERRHTHGRCSDDLLTGPNMAGKSTVLRQWTDLVMAQVGSFVPANRARIGSSTGYSPGLAQATTSCVASQRSW